VNDNSRPSFSGVIVTDNPNGVEINWQKASPACVTGIDATNEVTFTRLPERNSDFGDKYVWFDLFDPSGASRYPVVRICVV
jgi:hypothetical protein